MIAFTILLFMSLPKDIDLPQFDVYGPGSLALTEDGKLTYLDMASCQVLLFDANNQLIARKSMKGQGPGEILQPLGITYLVTTQQFVIYDGGNKKLTFWDLKLGHVKDEPVLNLGHHPILTDDGSLYSLAHFSGKGGKEPRLTVQEIGGQNEMPRTVYRYKISASNNIKSVKGVLVAVTFPWDQQLLYDAVKNQVVVSWSGENIAFSLVLPADQDPPRFFKTTLKPVPLQPAEVEGWLESLQPEMRPYIEKAMDPPEYWPIIQNLLVVADHIWVIGKKDAGWVPIEIYTADGDLTQKMTLPFYPQAVNQHDIVGWQAYENYDVIVRRKR